MTYPTNTAALIIAALARDPHITQHPTAGTIFEATVAGTESYVNEQGKERNKPFYQSVTVMGKFADILAQRGLTAGTPVLVEGKLEENSFETKEGKKVRNLRVRADRLDVLNEQVDTTTDATGAQRLTGGVNQVRLTGNLTRDPELRYTPGGDAVLGIGLAVNETWVKNGEKHERVHFFNLVLWRELAEAHQHLKKGDRIMVQGRTISQTWTDDDGEKRTAGKVEVTRLTRLARGAAQPQEQEQAAQPQEQHPSTGGLDIDQGLDFPHEDIDMPF